MSNISLLAIISQFAAALFGVFFFKRNNRSVFVLTLITMLIINVLVEATGLYFLSIEKSSYFLYVVYTFFNFNLINFNLGSIIKLKRKLSSFFLVFFNLGFFLFPFEELFVNQTVIGSLGTSVLAFMYLRQLLISDEILNYKKLLPFWVSVGFLIFYLPSIPFFSLFKYMYNRDLFFILKYLIILMNLFIIYGLITCNKEEKY